MSFPLKWEFPGGKVQTNETHEACIKRELLEELNIEIKLVLKLKSCYYKKGAFQITLIPFIAQQIHGKITLLEHHAIQWLPISELKYVDFAPPDYAVLSEFMNYINSPH
jgi:8-oxo-dGTP diphosphatase